MSTSETYWNTFWRRRISRRSALKSAVLGATGLTAAAIIGCGDDEEGGTNTPSASNAVEQPKRGGTIFWMNASTEAPHLDMHQNPFATPGSLAVYSRLARFDLDKFPDELAFTGELAESWELPDPSTWVFKLRHGVKFHNIPLVSGREFKAADVVYSYQRQRDEKVNAGTIRAIDKMEAVDDYTLKLTLTRPDADFLWSVGGSSDNRRCEGGGGG